jgi:hypothetical protein
MRPLEGWRGTRMLINVMIMMNRVTEEENGDFRSGQPVSGPGFELHISRIRTGIAESVHGDIRP